MKEKIFYIIIFLLSSYTLAQNKILEEKNGFKNIKLGSNISNYDFLKKEEYSSDAYKIKINEKDYTFNYQHSYVVDLNKEPSLKLIGDIKVLGIYVGTINDKIFEIEVVTEYNYRLYENFKTIFGTPYYSTSKPLDSTNIWKGNNITLSLTANYLINKNLFATYYSITYENDELKKQYENIINNKNIEKRNNELNKFRNDL